MVYDFLYWQRDSDLIKMQWFYILYIFKLLGVEYLGGNYCFYELISMF